MTGAFSRPILLLPGQPSRTLDRVPLAAGRGEAGYDEAWLQDVLFRHPEALPVSEIDESFAGLVPVCRELNTPAGPIDVLYATPTGRIAFVEAKLWRNPEARRKVIGQILDYAKELSQWSYERLDAAVRQARRSQTRTGGSAGLSDVIRERTGEFDEARFVDSVARSLKRGDFLLLIVGDGIREGVGSIVEFLEGHASLHFTFGLVELAIYRLPEGGQLVQPRVLTQSSIVRRTIVSLEGAGLIAQEPQMGGEAETEEDDEELQQQRRYFSEFWAEFLEGLRLDDQSQPVPGPARGQNLYFAMPSGSKSWVSTYVARSRQRVGVFLTFDRGPLAARMFEEFKEDAAAIENAIGTALHWEDDGEGKYRIIARKSFPDVAESKYRPEILAWMREKANRFITVFRPRLERFVRETK